MAESIIQRFQESLRAREEERKNRQATALSDSEDDEDFVNEEDQNIDLKSRLIDLLADFDMGPSRLNSHALTKRYVDRSLKRTIRRMEKLIDRQTKEIQSMQEDQTVVTCLMVVMTLMLVLYMLLQTFQGPIRRFFSSVRGLNNLMSALHLRDDQSPITFDLGEVSSGQPRQPTAEEAEMLNAALQELEIN